MKKLIDITNMRFGKLTAIEKLPSEGSGRTRWLCRCDCGSTCVAFSWELRNGAKKSCGCGRNKDLTGKRFGSLTAIRRSERYIEKAGRGKRYLWECRCDCGETVYRLPEKLREGTNSGCRNCVTNRKVRAMVNSAGFVEGTQISKLASTAPLTTSKSGVRGVFFNTKTGKWRVMLRLQGVDHYIGEFRQIEEAIEARKLAEKEYFAPILEQHGTRHKK